MIPQIQSSKIGGQLGGLASLAGINLGGASSENGIPPNLYPQIVNSVPFKKGMIKTLLSFKGYPNKISFEEYYSKEESPSLFSIIKKYTIGLPSLISSLKNIEKPEDKVTSKVDDLIRVSASEVKVFKLINSFLSVSYNDNYGIVAISSTLEEPYVAAELVQQATILLQDAIKEFKVKKVNEQLKFIQDRYDEKEISFTKAQLTLAAFHDKNIGLNSSRALMQLQKLQTEYDRSFSIFSELSKQLETQKIIVKENTPVFTIVEPVVIPFEKSGPNRSITVLVFGTS